MLATTLVVLLLVGAAVALPTRQFDTNDLSARIKKARQNVVGLGVTGPVWTPSQVAFFEHNEQFEEQPNNKFWLAWTPMQSQNLMRFTIAVQTTGWIAWGITQTGGMVGGSISVIRETSPGSGNFSCFAMHSDGFYTPEMNSDQNCQLLSYERQGNETLLTFQRPYIGCKPEDSDFIDDTTMRMMGAWGQTQTFSQHSLSDRFSYEINAVVGPIEPREIPDDAFIINITLPPHNLPTYRDVYYCNGHSFPSDRRYHMIKSDTILFNIAPASYHHYLMFGCPGGLPREYNDPDYMQDCPVIPHPTCIKFFNGWAIGQKAIYLEYGMPIGAGNGAVRDFLFQSHIDNPTEQAIFEPGWGSELTVTPTLTEIESGAFGLYSGVPLGGIPPGIERIDVRSECPSRMMQSAFPKKINIIMANPHMHGLGTSAKIQILRGKRWPRGSEWEEPYKFFEQTHYDGNWQGNRYFLNGGREVEPGDRLRVSCSFQTLNRTRNTGNGEGYEDEMCIHYMIYYPLDKDITICAEFPPEVLPPYERMSGIGISFADVPPFFWPIPRDSDTIEELPPPDNNCQRTL